VSSGSGSAATDISTDNANASALDAASTTSLCRRLAPFCMVPSLVVTVAMPSSFGIPHDRRVPLPLRPKPNLPVAIKISNGGPQNKNPANLLG
jgi:hypothetical protein